MIITTPLYPNPRRREGEPVILPGPWTVPGRRIPVMPPWAEPYWID